MASFIALNDAQEHLAELLIRAEGGEEILIEREGRPAMKIVPIATGTATSGKRVFGQNLLGITYIAPDFDDPMTEDELKEWGL